MTTGRPFRALARGERTFAVEGSPADCVRVALFKLAPAVDWVLSGINEGEILDRMCICRERWRRYGKQRCAGSRELPFPNTEQGANPSTGSKPSGGRGKSWRS